MEFIKFAAVMCVLYGCCFAIDSATEEIDQLKSHPGHMKPFGSVGPYFDIPVVEGFVSPRQFINNYFIPSIPVVFKNAAKISPAWTKWTDEYFLNERKAENITILAEGRKKEIRTGRAYFVSFKQFVEKYNKSSVYLVNEVPSFLRPDIIVPPPLQCKDFTKHFATALMWMSSGGTKSVVHFDDVDNINCLYRGSKTLIFINPHKTSSEWISNVIDRSNGGYSSMDVDMVDYTKFPHLVGTEFAKVDMVAGDCLFIPYKWLHQVNSRDNNLAVNIWFGHEPQNFINLNESECGDFTEKKFINQFEFSYDTKPKENKKVYGSKKEDKLPEEEEEVETESASKEQESLVENLFEYIVERKKSYKLEDVKKYVTSHAPDYSKDNWNENCDAEVNNFFNILDRNQDGLVDEKDADLISEMSNSERDALLRKSIDHVRHLGSITSIVKLQNDRQYLTILLDNDKLDIPLVKSIHGQDFIDQYLQEKAASKSKQKHEL